MMALDFAQKRNELKEFLELPLWAKRCFFLIFLGEDIAESSMQDQRRAVIKILSGPKSYEAKEKLRSMHIREVQLKDDRTTQKRSGAE